MAKIHVCLVSDQPLPNLLPILDGDLRPDRVVLLVSKRMRENGKARRLRSVLDQLVEVEETELPDITPAIVREYCRSILQRYESANDEIWLNVTGGTKVMALNAFSVFHERPTRPILYVDTDAKLYQRLDNDEAWSMPENLLTLQHYLAVYGFTIIDQGKALPGPWQNVARILGERAEEWRDHLAQFNQVSKAGGKLAPSTPPDLLDLLTNAGIGQVSGTPGKLRLDLAHEQALEFIKGGWLEALAESTVRSTGGVSEVGRGVKIKRSDRLGAEPDAELDVAFLYRNSLHIIECGSGKKGNEDLFKLTSRRDVVGGTFARGMMVAVRPDSDAKDPAEATWKAEQRANDLGVKLVLGPQIKDLQQKVTSWLSL